MVAPPEEFDDRSRGRDGRRDNRRGGRRDSRRGGGAAAPVPRKEENSKTEPVTTEVVAPSGDEKRE